MDPRKIIFVSSTRLRCHGIIPRQIADSVHSPSAYRRRSIGCQLVHRTNPITSFGIPHFGRLDADTPNEVFKYKIHIYYIGGTVLPQAFLWGIPLVFRLCGLKIQLETALIHNRTAMHLIHNY